MEKLDKLRTELHTEVKNLRNIEYMIQQESFGSLWIVSDDTEREKISKIIQARDKMRVINWIRKHPSLEIGEMSIQQLKDKARELHIRNYSRMNKPELLIMINASNKQPKQNNLTLEEMLSEIRDFTEQMDALMIEAGIPEGYLLLPESVEHIDIKYIEEGYEWISEIFNSVFRDARAIKNLLSDEMWDRYSKWDDFAEHREVILLRNALANLKKQIVNVQRPVLFKKSRIQKIIERAVKRRSK